MLKARQLSPDFSFLISHPSGRHILFDLGLRKDFDGNPTVIRADKSYISPTVPFDAIDLLRQGHVQPSQFRPSFFLIFTLIIPAIHPPSLTLPL